MKQNVNNKLAFNKAAVAELNDAQMNDVNGASSPLCYVAIGFLLAKALD